MNLIEYIKENPRKISFTIFIGFIAILGIIETFGTQIGIPENIIGYAVIISSIVAGLTGKSWKDYFKFDKNKEENEENIIANGDFESESLDYKTGTQPLSPNYQISKENLDEDDFELAEETSDEGA